MSDKELEAKQNYLRTEIIEAGLDAEKFVEQLVGVRGISRPHSPRRR